MVTSLSSEAIVTEFITRYGNANYNGSVVANWPVEVSRGKRVSLNDVLRTAGFDPRIELDALIEKGVIRGAVNRAGGFSVNLASRPKFAGTRVSRTNSAIANQVLRRLGK